MITYEQVAKAADELKARDSQRRAPGVRAVHELTKGDYNAVQKHMKTWRLTQVTSSPGSTPSLSPGFVRALNEEMTQQRNSATTAKCAELEQCREDLEDLQREYDFQASRGAEMEAELQVATAARERAVAERDHQGQRVASLEHQVSAEREAAVKARIELEQTRLKISGDSELVATLRAELDARHADFEAERAARIEAERKFAASEAAHHGLMARMEDHSARMEEIEADRDLFRKGLEMERSKRVEAERGRDNAEQRAVAATARADDLWAREAELRARLDQLMELPTKPRPAKRPPPAKIAKSA